jgi:hypothetical protein
VGVGAHRVVAEDGVAEGDEHAAGELGGPAGVVGQPLVLRRLVLVCPAPRPAREYEVSKIPNFKSKCQSAALHSSAPPQTAPRVARVTRATRRRAAPAPTRGSRATRGGPAWRGTAARGGGRGAGARHPHKPKRLPIPCRKGSTGRAADAGRAHGTPRFCGGGVGKGGNRTRRGGTANEGPGAGLVGKGTC